MDEIPTWIGAIGALLVIATALGAAVAVYRTSVQGTSLREARATILDLRGEIGDHERREAKLEADVRVLEAERESSNARVKIMEDLLTKRHDDAEIRQEIRDLRRYTEAILQILGEVNEQ